MAVISFQEGTDHTEHIHTALLSRQMPSSLRVLHKLIPNLIAAVQVVMKLLTNKNRRCECSRKCSTNPTHSQDTAKPLKRTLALDFHRKLSHTQIKGKQHQNNIKVLKTTCDYSCFNIQIRPRKTKRISHSCQSEIKTN